MGYILFQNSLQQLIPVVIKITVIDNTVQLSAGEYLQSIVINPLAADTIDISINPSDKEFADDLTLEANENNTVEVERKFKDATTILFEGLTDDATVTLYKR